MGFHFIVPDYILDFLFHVVKCLEYNVGTIEIVVIIVILKLHSFLHFYFLQMQIRHIPDKLMPLYMHNRHNIQPATPMPQQLENGRAKEEENRRQQEMLEMMKYSQRLLYTVIATIGIPVVLLVVFHIDVSGVSLFSCLRVEP